MKCTICATQTEYLLKKEDYTLYICKKCGLVFVHPQPTEQFLKEKVYSLESGYQGNKRRDLQNALPDKKTRNILAYLETLSPTGKKLLDVGCSNGEFIYMAAKLGFDVYGVEVNKRTADIAKENGLKVFNGFLSDAGYVKDSFDIIFLGDIIEHVTSPQNFIAECSSLLKKGGVMIISTPNLDCFWSKSTFALYRAFKIPWSSVTPPHHLFQFSYGNLAQLMGQHGLTENYRFFLRPPRLMYELGGLHLLKRFKKEKTLKNALFMGLSFLFYTLLYSVDFLLTPLKKKDFSMVVAFLKK